MSTVTEAGDGRELPARRQGSERRNAAAEGWTGRCLSKPARQNGFAATNRNRFTLKK